MILFWKLNVIVYGILWSKIVTITWLKYTIFGGPNRYISSIENTGSDLCIVPWISKALIFFFFDLKLNWLFHGRLWSNNYDHPMIKMNNFRGEMSSTWAKAKALDQTCALFYAFPKRWRRQPSGRGGPCSVWVCWISSYVLGDKPRPFVHRSFSFRATCASPWSSGTSSAASDPVNCNTGLFMELLVWFFGG